MKRWFLIAAAVSGILFLPKGQGNDVGELQPMELLYIYKEGDRIVIETDTGDKGIAYCLDDAILDIQKTAVGVVFLETADYLLVTEQTKHLIPQLETVLRPAVKVVLATGVTDLENMTMYLSAQKPKITLKDCLISDQMLPKLMTAEERYYLVQ